MDKRPKMTANEYDKITSKFFKIMVLKLVLFNIVINFLVPTLIEITVSLSLLIFIWWPHFYLKSIMDRYNVDTPNFPEYYYVNFIFGKYFVSIPMTIFASAVLIGSIVNLFD